MTQHKILEAVIALARQAGQLILQYYQDVQHVAVTHKADQSPLTQADLAAHHCIVDGLEQLGLGWPIISEESTDIPDFSGHSVCYWLVDPLDGTKEFLKGNDEFTVNIALIDCCDTYPVLSVVYAPALDTLYYAAQGQGAYKQKDQLPPRRIHCNEKRPKQWQVAVSRSHPSPELQQALQPLGDYRLVAAGSSLKLCLVAEGQADLYPRLGPTSKWDIAAGQCIVEQAGGQVVYLSNRQRFAYPDQDCRQLNRPFLAYGMAQCPDLAWLLADEIVK